jgi:hypothetical protein
MSRTFSRFTITRGGTSVTYHGWRELSSATGLSITSLRRCVEMGTLPDGAQIAVEGVITHPRMGRPQNFVRVRLAPDLIKQSTALAAQFGQSSDDFLSNVLTGALMQYDTKDATPLTPPAT